MTDGRRPETSRRVREQTGSSWKLPWNVGGGKKCCFKVPAPGFASVFALAAFTFLLHPLHNEAVILLRY